MWEYKTETFNTLFDSNNAIGRKIDNTTNKYASEGWELDKFQCSDLGGCLKILIFRREKK